MDDIELIDLDDLLLENPETDSDSDEGAYIKREVIHFRPVYSIYSSSGELLAQAATRHKAFLMVRRNDLTPYDVQ